ncbi:hypothetical protein RhiirA1_540293 [Rhizophagus irregularis]|uniref:F-box domain-containing protein n=1 Tax=Rhizophagus irregularis TaxID=588596 RepID=A0A2I1FGA9_9GLOM|nr:hypothetical protein RhiirA1_540293 [Rhizophagus irregularis]PKY33357.1 hypothetical protein RhiirB3_452183 [Rhizophagus irregularis]CAB5303670.1 unnamed protein product [Rhizophagus irregularis]
MIKLNLDCFNLILKESRLNKKSLYSCLLVNKEWCNLVVPILWKKYSWYCNHKESENKIFNIILSCLSTSSKQFLFDNNIKLPSTIFLKPLSFNYISFCEFPRAGIIDNIKDMIFKDEILNNFDYSTKINLLEQEIYKLFVSQCKNIKILQWKTSQPLSLFPGAKECFSQLNNLYISIDSVSPNSLYEMIQICRDLNGLMIYNCSQNLPGLISLIDAQKNLKRLSLFKYIKKEYCKELSNAIKRKYNTLNDICLHSLNIISPSFLTSLINLKNLSIYNYDNDNIRGDIKEFQHYLMISEFSELEYIDFYGLSWFEELAILIEKTKGNILQIIINPINKNAENTGLLIKAIANNCPKINRLYTHLEPKDFIHVKSLLLNCRNLSRIEFDSLNILVNENYNFGDELLNILTEFSPKSLIYISLSGDWKFSTDSFELFFESCRIRNINLLYFGITHESYITRDHMLIIRRYINEGIIKGSNCV